MNPFVPPLLESTPQRLSPEEIDSFARRTGWIDDILVISADTSAVERFELPWWDGVELIIARDPTWPGEGAMGAWMRDKHLHRLDGTSPIIHAMNAKVRPSLNRQTVLPYLGFFCTFVNASEGPFTIVESVEDCMVPPDAPVVELQKVARPTTILDEREDGIHCEALVWYSNAVFLANFVVKPDGMVEMLDDEPIIADTGTKIPFQLKFSDEEEQD